MNTLDIVEKLIVVASLALSTFGLWRIKRNADKIKLQESAKQEVQHTRQEKNESDREEFELIKTRVETAEKYALEALEDRDELRSRISNLEKVALRFESRANYAEHYICLKPMCEQREPALGTFNYCHKEEGEK